MFKVYANFDISKIEFFNFLTFGRVKHFKRKCFSVIKQKQSCSHELQNSDKSLQPFSRHLLNHFVFHLDKDLKNDKSS